MDYTSIQELIKTVSNSKLSSLEIETEGIRIVMKKGEEVSSKVVVEQKEIKEEKIEEPQIIKKIQEEVSLESEETHENLETISSPIVGTFYYASAPDAEPFVKIGSKVKKGEVLCIVEAMKLMNEIEAEENYEIVEMLVENEEMVEYGQPLFKARKI
ncbi:acetyl-CoA carboxylase biotin carboxyl carrier protein [Clostridium aestuarii]|uniref:Biotin carboxyl carrier protein of acetyl-CoA carboxylase n=1 Tax=Clostridium aestuarii TaxID=338193 RepID=A0ABT4D1Z9_9CLOT|nr:acetyl-CoA carboxylase biotin carboxyl carrier protein [Clostridium aestuarii]MCY6485278.1 acetyl-CoA carboxylase biotin carboxyl carrier protein [Clostridium aestuarii]